jgi:hypothetical protein
MLRTKQAYEVNQEIFGIYSPQSTNMHSLIQYGYITPGNMNDFVVFRIDFTNVEETLRFVPLLFFI